MDIHADELLALLDIDRHDSLQEVDKAFCMISLRKIEVNAVVHFLDVDRILVCAVLQNSLLEIQKGPFVRHLLSDLNARPPGIVRVTLCAIGALVVVLRVFDLETLLHDGAIAQIRLHRNLDFDAPRVRFCPDEACIDDAQLVETS